MYNCYLLSVWLFLLWYFLAINSLMISHLLCIILVALISTPEEVVLNTLGESFRCLFSLAINHRSRFYQFLQQWFVIRYRWCHEYTHFFTKRPESFFFYLCELHSGLHFLPLVSTDAASLHSVKPRETPRVVLCQKIPTSGCSSRKSSLSIFFPPLFSCPRDRSSPVARGECFVSPVHVVNIRIILCGWRARLAVFPAGFSSGHSDSDPLSRLQQKWQK